MSRYDAVSWTKGRICGGREFLGVLGGATASWPLAVRAQQAGLPVVGFLRSASIADVSHFVTAFRQGLREAGFVEGQNVVVEYHSAEGQSDRLRSLVVELIRRPATVIVGNTASALAAKATTTTVPIVFAVGGDPIKLGLVASLNRPGGNVTGVHFFGGVLGAKRLEVLRQLVPKAATIAMLVPANNPDTETERRDVQAAALVIGQQLLILDVSSERDIEAAFEIFVQRRVGTLLVGSEAFLNSHRERIVALAALNGLPTSFSNREPVAAGGLMSYGTSIPDAYRQAGLYTGRILKGEKPADLPVIQATKFEFVINLKTAKALGLEFHPQLLATADEVIE